MKMPAIVSAAVAAGLLVTGVAPVAMAEPIPHGSNHIYSGYIETGRKLGVRIGDPIATVEPRPTRHNVHKSGDVYECSAYGQELLGCHAGDLWQCYRVTKIGKDGNIYVRYENDRVVAIAWSFNFWPPMEL